MDENTRLTECALSFCEIYEVLLRKYGNVLRIVKEGCRAAGFQYCDRIYIGSDFCGNYLLRMNMDQYKKLKNLTAPLTLNVPVITQRNLEQAKKKISDLREMFGASLDEIVVNDFGMLEWAGGFEGLSVRLGRLFFKNLRDPRYTDPGTDMHSIFRYQKELMKRYGVSGTEIDSIFPAWKKFPDEKDMVDVPAEFGVSCAFHRPYGYMSTGQICEYASIGRPADQKFVPNAPCSGQCQRYLIEYQMRPEENFVRLGRAILIPVKRMVPKEKAAYRDVYFMLDQGVEL